MRIDEINHELRPLLERYLNSLYRETYQSPLTEEEYNRMLQLTLEFEEACKAYRIQHQQQL